MSKSGGFGKTSSNSGTSVDPQTQAWIKQIMAAAAGAGAAGPSPLVTGGVNNNNLYAAAGAKGLAALTGDPNAVAGFMNPFTQNVIDANSAAWNNINKQTTNQINADATAQGAFGGSRAAVANGAALSQNNIAQGQQTAGLLSSGYDTAMQQAQAAAGMGYNANQANINLGMNGVGNAQQWLMNMLKTGFSGLPVIGTNTSGSQTGYGMSYKTPDPSSIMKLAGMGG